MRRAVTRSGLTVLVVDDHVELAENLAEILGGAGFATRVESNAARALAALTSSSRVDLVLTDYTLPDMTGAELITELRSRGQQIPALVMSARTDPQTVEAARAAGAHECLAKPLDIAQLLGQVASLLPEAPLTPGVQTP